MACSLHLFAWLDFRTKALLSQAVVTQRIERLFKRWYSVWWESYLCVCLYQLRDKTGEQESCWWCYRKKVQEEDWTRRKQDNWCNFLLWVRRRQKEMPKFPLIRGTHEALTPCRVIRGTYYSQSTYWESRPSSWYHETRVWQSSWNACSFFGSKTFW